MRIFAAVFMKWSRRKLNNLFFVIGIAGVIVMLLTFDVSFIELWHHLCRAGYWLVPIIGIWAIIYAINAQAWMVIIRNHEQNGEHVGFWRIYQLTISGYALNYATPVGGLGGEPYRMMELSKDMDNRRAASSVILYAMMHVFAHFWLWFSTIFLYIALAVVGDLPMNTLTVIVLVVIGIFCLIAFYLFSRGYRYGLVKKTIRGIGKVPGLKGWSQRMLERHGDALSQVDSRIASLHQQDKRTFYISLLLEYAARIVQSLEIMFMLLLFGIDCGGGLTGLTLTFCHAILILSFTTLLANLIGFLPMQLGVQEGGFAISTAAMGLTAALGLFVSIICRVREIVWIIIGIALMRT